MGPEIPVVKVTEEGTQEIQLIGKEGVFRLQMSSSSLFGAQRVDMAAPFDLTNPSDSRERINVMWKAYDYDSGFRYLIDRLAHYGSNGYSFFSDKPSEVPFWNEWSQRINEGLPTVIPGLREIIKWNIKHLALGAFAYNNWEWGSMKIGKRMYQVPIHWNLQNQRAVVITRKGNGFDNEKVGLYTEERWLQDADSTFQEAYTVADPKDFGAQTKLAVAKDGTWFLLKFHTSQGDNTIDSNKPQTAMVASSLYPTPPFFSLLPTIKQRQQLKNMDLSIVDGFINKIVHWKIGDKDNPPMPDKYDKDGKLIQEGTITNVKAVITKDNKGAVVQLFTPYWVTMEIITPDIQPLLSVDKYAQPWLEMLWAFGILARPGNGADTFTEINVRNFDQLIAFYREEHIEAMLENVIFRMIAKKNNLAIPEIRFNPVNTASDEFLRNIRELAGMGKMSTDTLLRFHRMDKKFELPIITQELTSSENKEEIKKMSEEEIFNMNTPVKFKQEVVDESGAKTTKSSSTAPGRPAGKKDSKQRAAA
jgi:hypothetical protein